MHLKNDFPNNSLPRELNLTAGDAAPAPSGASGGASSGSVAQYLRDPGWKDLLEQEFSQPYFQSLDDQLAKDYGSGMEIFPPKDLIFNAFNLTPLKKVQFEIVSTM